MQGNQGKGLKSLIKHILPEFNKFYKTLLGEDRVINAETLEKMIVSRSEVRLALAIDMSLPPILRVPVKYLAEIYQAIYSAA